jgi:hypothetical protein
MKTNENEGFVPLARAMIVAGTSGGGLLLLVGHRPAADLLLTAATLDAAAGAAAAVVAWGLAAWLLTALLVTALSACPARLGVISALVAARITPRVLHGCVRVVLASGVAAASAATAWPVAAAEAAPAAAPAPAPDAGFPTLDRPVPDPVRRLPVAHVVRPGESLWRVAALHLGDKPTDEAIAAAWPRWHAANRAVIGPDPGLLRPGQRLVAPPLEFGEDR